MAGVATPLVVSVHTIIGFDFATALTPGWHSTIFPPYFVIGALHSGFAMVLVLLIPSRAARGFRGVVTGHHLDAVARLLLVTACLMALCYAIEGWIAWHGAEPAELRVFAERALGSAAGPYWLMLTLNCVAPQVLWAPAARRSPPALVAVGLAVLIGMWIERYVIVAHSLTHGYLPSSWGRFVPTAVDVTTFAGTLGLFLFLFLTFLRWLPYVAASEVKKVAHEEAAA
jgi:molybdopterin-containing oxidoreductase family membrane subunit